MSLDAFSKSPKISPGEARTTPEGPRRIGEIVHRALGVGTEGHTKPLTLEQLKGMYDTKEIAYALKAALFSMTMRDVAQSISSRVDDVPLIFDAWNQIDYARLKYHILSALDHAGQKTLGGSFREIYPVAYGSLTTVLEHDYGGGKEGVFDALDLGLDVILALHKFISDRVPREAVGGTMMRSAHVLYAMASQNVEKSIRIVFEAMESVVNPDKEQTVRGELADALRTLGAVSFTKVRSHFLDVTLQDLVHKMNENTEYTQAAAELETLLHDDAMAYSFFAGTLEIPWKQAYGADVTEYFDLEKQFAFVEIERALRNEKHVDQTLQNTIAQLRGTLSVHSLKDEYFSLEENSGEYRVMLRNATEPTPGRADKKLFRHEVNGVGADLIEPDSKTVGCAALYSSIPYTPELETVAHRVGFHPPKLNGIGFTTLFMLHAVDQAAQKVD